LPESPGNANAELSAAYQSPAGTFSWPGDYPSSLKNQWKAGGSYGWYQSLGCVELPWNEAAKAYPYLTYGSLVTVTGPVA
jgi:hypothetical protein